MKNLSSSTFAFKAIFIGLLVTLSFVFGPSGVTAQTTKDNTYDVPQGNFVNVDEAIIRLNLALENLKISMSPMDPHSDGYKTMETRNRYFDNIRIILEEGKGTDLYRDTHTMLANSTLHGSYVGNVEGRGLYHGEADVIVCEGFVGHVVLKVSEGMAEFHLKAGGGWVW